MAFPQQPAAFVRIAPDNTVTVVVKHLDKGGRTQPERLCGRTAGRARGITV